MLLASALATLALPASAAQAAGGCGVGFHCGPGDGRRPNVVRGPAVVVPVPAPMQRHEAANKKMHRLRILRLQRDSIR
jgi:hypothetical protein